MIVQEHEFSYPSSDGVHTIYAHAWVPDAPRGVVQIVHGIAEYIERYRPFAQFLAEAGYVVVGHDLLGHGKTVTDGEFGYFGARDGWANLLADIHRLRNMAGERYPTLPYVLMGHSMGSFLVRHYMIDYPDAVDAVILSGTGYESPRLLVFGQAFARMFCALRGGTSRSKLIFNMSLGNYNRAFRPCRTPSDWLSRDVAVVDAFIADEFCSFAPSSAMFRDMLGGLLYIAKPVHIAKMRLDMPIYFFSGACDPVGQMGVGVKRVASLFKQAGCVDISLKLYPDGRHEMLNELNRQEVYADVLAWLKVKG